VPFGAQAIQVKNESTKAKKSATGAIQRTPFLCSVQTQVRSPADGDAGLCVTTVGSGGRYGSVGRGSGMLGVGGGAASIAAPVNAGGVNAFPHCGHGVIWPADESGNVTSCWHDGHRTRMINHLAARKARGK
jgi:hypothetical protein